MAAGISGSARVLVQKEKNDIFLLPLPTGNEKEMDMRQLWTRVARPRSVLVVAAISVITLAASSPISSAVRGSHVTRPTSASHVAAAGGTSGASGDCSKAAALEVAARFDLADPSLPLGQDQIAKVFCGAFVGPGSQAMVVAFTPGTCGINGWAVFSFTGGDWQLVGPPHRGWIFAVAAVGSDIRETAPVPTGKFQCPLTNGKPRSRIWHWDGTRLVAGPWKQVMPATPVRSAVFRTPSRNIICSLGDSSDYLGVICSSFKAPLRVKMDAGGRLKICHGRRCVVGCGCVPEGISTLGYGKQITVGRFRCRSQRSGVTCTVIRSGKGFLISRTGVRRVGP